MLVETFINPLNLPNLLTPFRYNLEIQYIIFAILFVSLLGYVLFIFLDYIGSLDKILILLGVFVVLLFLFLVIKERDRLDELTLQEEAVDMAEELAKIERDVKVKEFLREEAKKGIIYDENDRIEKGKADTAKVTNLRSEINKLQTRKKEILDKQKNLDGTFLRDAQDQVKKSAESEMKQITKKNKDLENKLQRITGETSYKLDSLVQQRSIIENRLRTERDATKRKQLEVELQNTKQQIDEEEENMKPLTIESRDRVEIDRVRKELKDLRDRRKNVEGLTGDVDVSKRDINIFKKKEIYDAEEKMDDAREKYMNSGSPEDKKKYREAINKYNSSLNNKRFDAGNRGIQRAEELINAYDGSTDGRAMESKYKEIGVYNKLEGLEEEARKASKLTKTTADLTNSSKGSEKDQLEALTRAVMENIPSGSGITKTDIETELKSKKDYAERAKIAARIVKQEKIMKQRPGISQTNAKTVAEREVNNQIDSDIAGLSRISSDQNIKINSAFIKSLTGVDNINRSFALVKAENKLNRDRERAEREAFDSIFDRDKQNVKERLDNRIYRTDSYGNRSIKEDYSAVKNKKEENFLENIETFDRLIADDSLPGKYDGAGNAVKSGLIPDEKDEYGEVISYTVLPVDTNNAKYKREDPSYNKKNLRDFRDLVYQLSSQLKENPGVETGEPDRKKLKNILQTQKLWLEIHGL